MEELHKRVDIEQLALTMAEFGIRHRLDDPFARWIHNTLYGCGSWVFQDRPADEYHSFKLFGMLFIPSLKITCSPIISCDVRRDASGVCHAANVVGSISNRDWPSDPSKARLDYWFGSEHEGLQSELEEGGLLPPLTSHPLKALSDFHVM